MLCGPLPSRALSTVALLALLLATAPFPAADAQFGIGSAPSDTQLLPDALAPVEVLSDPEGDTVLMGNTPFPPGVDGENDYESTADIVSLSVSENQDNLVFGLKHRAYPETSAAVSDLVLFQGLRCSIGFHVNSDDTRFYEMRMDSEAALDWGKYRGWTMLYEFEQDAGDPDRFESEIIEFFLWTEMIAYDHFEIVVPKEILTADGKGRSLRIGDELTNMHVECTRDVTLLVGYHDEAGGENVPSVPYTLSAATRSGELEIGFSEPEEGEPSALTVAPEGATKLSVVIKNLRERKLLVNVTAKIADASGQPLKDWTVQTAPTFELNANASLPASLIITPPENVQHRDGGYLTVRAIPLGFDDHVQVTRWVSAVVSPTPELNTLYFHDPGGEWFYCTFICTGSDDDTLPRFAHGPDQFVMNTLQVDPRLGETDTANEGVALFSQDHTYVYLDAPLGEPLRFDPEGMFELTMSLRTDVERDIRIDGYLWAGNEVVGAFTSTATVGSTFATHTVQFMPNLDFLAVPAGSWVGLEVYVREDGPIPISFTGSTWVDSVDWRPAESSLTMPLLSVPKKVSNITDGRALPTLALSNETDSEEYLNPGDTQAFDLLLVNEGREKDVVGLKADLPKGWHVSFYPGDQFDLASGSSAPLCVSITAPEDAKDSDTVKVNLTAWSRSDPDVRTSTQLTLIVIDSLDIEEQECTEQEGYVRPFTDRENTTPGASAPALIGLLALIGVALRRRL